MDEEVAKDQRVFKRCPPCQAAFRIELVNKMHANGDIHNTAIIAVMYHPIKSSNLWG